MNRSSAFGEARIGVVGTGFTAQGLVKLLAQFSDLNVSKILTRRPLADCAHLYRSDLLTNSLAELLDHSTIIIECSGDVPHATNVVHASLQARLPVITMDAEFQVTTGSYFVEQGLLTEAEGDQPGSLAALHEDVVQMGFRPLVYGNSKGFLNHQPTEADMTYWSQKQGIRLEQATSFTDGTKVQIEQTLVANGLGATIYQPGMLGWKTPHWQQAAHQLGRLAEEVGQPLSDYLVTSGLPGGVFVVATHATASAAALEYLKLGSGPYYILERPFHLCYFEIVKTLRRVLRQSHSLFNNSARPRIGVAAVAKVPLSPGDRIPRGLGSFTVRGVAVPIHQFPNHVPIGLLQDATVLRAVPPGDFLTWDAVELPESLARTAWLAIKERVLQESPVPGQCAPQPDCVIC